MARLSAFSTCAPTADFLCFFAELDGHGTGEDVRDGSMPCACRRCFAVVLVLVLVPVPEVLAGGLVPADPGSGDAEPLVVGDDGPVGDVVTGGDVVVGGLLVGVVGDVLAELLADGLVPPVLDFPSELHLDAAEELADGLPDSPGEAAPVGRGVPPPFTPEPPPWWPDPACVLPEDENAPLCEMACGSVMTAKAPAPITKIAVPIAATGRSQAKRGRA
jgi:hypothetical protein